MGNKASKGKDKTSAKSSGPSTGFVAAAKAGNMNAVTKFLQGGCDIDERDEGNLQYFLYFLFPNNLKNIYIR